jgi:hypothetical protein
MSLGTQDWADAHGMSDLWDELDIHVSSAEPEDFARLAMISFRQWLEMEQSAGRLAFKGEA